MKLYKVIFKNNVIYGTSDNLVLLNKNIKLVGEVNKNISNNYYKLEGEHLVLFFPNIKDFKEIDVVKYLKQKDNWENRKFDINTQYVYAVKFLSMIGYIQHLKISRELLSSYPSILIEKGNIYGYGRSTTFDKAKKIAILEFIERLFNSNINFIQKSVFQSYKKLKSNNNILNPEKIILGKNTKYNENLKISWHYAIELKTLKNIYIPTQLCYYDWIENQNANPSNITYTTSNGFSLGGSLKEAILYGILEIIERHNFLKMWYYYKDPVKIDLNKSKISKSVMNEINIIENRNKIKAHFFLHDYELEKIQVVTCIIEGQNKYQKNYVAASANFDLEKAMLSAFKEAAVGISLYKERINMTLNKKIKSQEDHINWHLRNESNYISYLKTMNEKKVNNVKNEFNVDEKLEYITEKMPEKIIVSNATSNILEKFNIFCVKILVIGMLPMTFGLQNERLIMEKNNYEPHPFP